MPGMLSSWLWQRLWITGSRVWKCNSPPFPRWESLTVLFSLAVDHFYQDEVAFGQASGISAKLFSATNHFFIQHVTWHLWCYKLVQEGGHPFHLFTKGSVLMFSEVIYFCFRGQCSFALLLCYQEKSPFEPNTCFPLKRMMGKCLLKSFYLATFLIYKKSLITQIPRGSVKNIVDQSKKEKEKQSAAFLLPQQGQNHGNVPSRLLDLYSLMESKSRSK